MEGLLVGWLSVCGLYANPMSMLSQRCSVSESGACHQPTFEELLPGNSGVHRAPTQALKNISATTCMAWMDKCHCPPTPQDLSLYHFMSKGTVSRVSHGLQESCQCWGRGSQPEGGRLVSLLLGAWWAVEQRGEEMIWFLRASRAELDLRLRPELGTAFNYLENYSPKE